MDRSKIPDVGRLQEGQLVDVQGCAHVDEDDSPHSVQGWWFVEDVSSLSSVDHSSSSALYVSQSPPADDVAGAAADAVQNGNNVSSD
jgi:hypothetical protein